MLIENIYINEIQELKMLIKLRIDVMKKKRILIKFYVSVWDCMIFRKKQLEK